MQLTLASLAALMATAGAILITQPTAGASVDVDKNWQVKWDYVENDSPNFCLYLTDHNDHPPLIIPLTEEVRTNSSSATIQGDCYKNLRSKMRVRASPCGEPETIWAQSFDFNASQSSCPSGRVHSRDFGIQFEE